MLKCSFDIERQWALPLIAGIDEAGRGCLAGPVVAAAVVFPAELRDLDSLSWLSKVTDSKLLKPEIRKSLREEIEKTALAFGIAEVDHLEIDRINILQATFEAARQALKSLESKLGKPVDLLLMDGNQKVPGVSREQASVIQGDRLSKSIAAASILAKVYRDDLMHEYSNEFPEYGFQKHKGYGTAEHRAALLEKGPCKIHRVSFLKNFARISLGQISEAKVAEYLTENKFKVIETNWRTKYGEIDIVAESERGLHFIEVRSRSKFSEIAQVFPPMKQKKLVQMAEMYRHVHAKKRNDACHIDLLVVEKEKIFPFWDVLVS